MPSKGHTRSGGSPTSAASRPCMRVPPERALLAYMAPHERDRFFQEVSLQKLTPSTTVNRKALEKELVEVSERGAAFGFQDRVLGVSAAVAAVTIAGPAERCTRERCEMWIEPLTAATREIATILSPNELDHEKNRPPAGRSRRRHGR